MLYDIVRKSLLAGLGVQEKVKELVDDLVKKGELNEREGAKLVKEFMDKAKSSRSEFDKKLSEGVAMGYEKANIATRDDLEKLTKKVQQLTLRVKKLENEVHTEVKEE